MEEGYVTPPCPCPSNQAKCDERSAGNDQAEPQGDNETARTDRSNFEEAAPETWGLLRPQ